MSLDKRYNIPEETVKKMVRDGVISCSVAKDFEIFEAYQQYANSVDASGKSKAEIYIIIAEKFRYNSDTVKKIIYKIGKI